MRTNIKKRPAANADGPDTIKCIIQPRGGNVKPFRGKKSAVLAAAGWSCMLLLLGVLGGMDRGAIGVCAGLAASFGLLAGGALALWKAGWLR